MKSKTIYFIATTLLMGSIVASCDSCNKKQDANVTTATESPMTTESSDVATTDTTATIATQATGTTSAGKGAQKGNTSKTATDKPDKGYSAADGTDAENNDGDQYTRNDKTPMPSGPPIK